MGALTQGGQQLRPGPGRLQLGAGGHLLELVFGHVGGMGGGVGGDHAGQDVGLVAGLVHERGRVGRLAGRALVEVLLEQLEGAIAHG